ncbi:Reticulon [Musa troglodytarum]|uniref:Reticulon-like protein n=1 Tax=Musa troglodytarum TaxID=320322 RepID=A0A9E7IE82_9LILI|nr:Reticulon [Musa troglodytarum]
MGGGGEERWCLVTGGRGFAARHLVEMLLRSDIWCVRVADLAPSISLDPREEDGALGHALRSGRAVYVSADLRNRAHLVKAFEGIEVVFHMAAPDSSINNHQLHYSVNVEGTKNVIDACIECKVKRLIYTSSSSVFNDSYSETKAEGEKLVVKANGRNGLLTCCIRPSSIFGPGDRLLVPSLYIIGDGNNVNDFTYVENVAHAHICAEQTLASEVGAKKAGGQAYFITNMEPIKFWEFMSLILEGLGYKRPSTKIPVTFMMPIAHMVESTYKLLSRYGMPVPQLTPSRIRLLSCNRTFNCSKAKDQIGYEPIVMAWKTRESYSHLKAEHKKTTSKAYLCLGGGKIANTLLWKDQKQSVTALLLLIAIYYYLFTSGYTLITAMAKLLSFVALFLFIHGALPKKIFGYKIEKMPPSYFNISAEQARSLACSATYSWNNGIGILRSLCKGKDWSLMFKVIIFLLSLNVLGMMSLQTIYKIGVFITFFAFYVYEKWEDAIDNSFNDAFSCLLRLKSEATQRLLKHK